MLAFDVHSKEQHAGKTSVEDSGHVTGRKKKGKEKNNTPRTRVARHVHLHTPRQKKIHKDSDLNIMPEKVKLERKYRRGKTAS